MIQSLFQLGARDYTRLRRLLIADASVGRPPEPDDATSHALWHVWNELITDDTSTQLKPEDYLRMHERTDASMRTIWNLTQRWSTYGNLLDDGLSDEPSREPGE